MRIETKFTLVGALLILLLDTVASLFSTFLRISYVLFLPASIAVYFWITYRAAEYLNTLRAIAFGAFLGLVDATIGWKISNWLATDSANVSKNLAFGRRCRQTIFPSK